MRLTGRLVLSCGTGSLLRIIEKPMIKEIDGRWTCSLCGYQWSAMTDERSVPAVCPCEHPLASTPIEMSESDIKAMVAKNVIGWFAIRHKEGWWVGNEDGVTCYGLRELAQYALTIIWQREGGRRLDYRIHRFTGVTHANGVHEPKYSAEEALNRYEKESKHGNT